MGFNPERKSKKRQRSTNKKSSIPKFVQENMISIEDELPPDSSEQLLIWEEVVKGAMAFEVRNARKTREHINVDMYMGLQPKTKYWMRLEYG